MDWIVPQDFIDQNNNLMEEVYVDCPDMAQVVDGIEFISIQNDEIIFKARRQQDQVSQVDDEETSESLLSNKHWNNGARALLSTLLF